MVSAGCAGLAGALLALSAGVTNSAEFPLALSIYLLAGVVLGGTGSLMGVWWGAIIVVYLPNEWAMDARQRLPRQLSLVSANLAIIIFGLVLVVMMLVAPSGIQGGLRWVAARVAAYFSSDAVTNMTLPLQAIDRTGYQPARRWRRVRARGGEAGGLTMTRQTTKGGYR